MRNFKAIAAGSLIGLGTLAAMPAAAEVEGSFGVATEYVFRGVTSGDPQVWGALDWSHSSGLYSGMWISNTSAGGAGSGNEEVDYYAGYAFDAGAVSLDFGGIYYAFPSQPSQANTGITEVYAGLTAGMFSGYLWYAPAGIDGPDDDEYAYLDLNLDIPVSEMCLAGNQALDQFGFCHRSPRQYCSHLVRG